MRLPAPLQLCAARLLNLGGLARNLVDAPVLVLCYHRVTRVAGDANAIVVSPERFRAQLAYLKAHYPILRFEESWQGVRRPSVVVTFDDGYADNLSEALPILDELGVPATFFVSTGELGGGEFWWDALERQVTGPGRQPGTLTLEFAGASQSWPSATKDERQALFRTLHNRCLGSDPASRQEILRQVAAWAGDCDSSPEVNRQLTVPELRQLAAHPDVTIGAHSVSHQRLAGLTVEEQRREIAGSGLLLAQLLGREVRVFSYPFGQADDFDDTSVDLCREAGYVKAAAAFPGEAHRWTDPFRIPRHFVYDWDLDRFRYKLKRLWI